MAVIIEFDFRSYIFMFLLTLKIEGKTVLNGSQGLQFRCLHLYLCKQRIDPFSRSPSGWESNICGFILVKAQMEHHKLMKGSSSLSILPIIEYPYRLASRMKSGMAMKLELIPSTIKLFMPPNWQILLNLYLKGESLLVSIPIVRSFSSHPERQCKINPYIFFLFTKTKLPSFESLDLWSFASCSIQDAENCR